eukprot:scaffold10284_cov118-Isochrysis_galbana.AAC.15
MHTRAAELRARPRKTSTSAEDTSGSCHRVPHVLNRVGKSHAWTSASTSSEQCRKSAVMVSTMSKVASSPPMERSAATVLSITGAASASTEMGGWRAAKHESARQAQARRSGISAGASALTAASKKGQREASSQTPSLNRAAAHNARPRSSGGM